MTFTKDFEDRIASEGVMAAFRKQLDLVSNFLHAGLSSEPNDEEMKSLLRAFLSNYADFHAQWNQKYELENRQVDNRLLTDAHSNIKNNRLRRNMIAADVSREYSTLVRILMTWYRHFVNPTFRIPVGKDKIEKFYIITNELTPLNIERFLNSLFGDTESNEG